MDATCSWRMEENIFRTPYGSNHAEKEVVWKLYKFLAYLFQNEYFGK